jgi:hypothetical protein
MDESKDDHALPDVLRNCSTLSNHLRSLLSMEKDNKKRLDKHQTDFNFYLKSKKNTPELRLNYEDIIAHMISLQEEITDYITTSSKELEMYLQKRVYLENTRNIEGRYLCMCLFIITLYYMLINDCIFFIQDCVFRSGCLEK